MPLYEKSKEALDDWRNIIEYTLDHHGAKQTEQYAAGLIKCIEAMVSNTGYYKNIEIKGRIVRVKHCQKHYIFCLLSQKKPPIIIAFLHERMNLMKQLKGRLE